MIGKTGIKISDSTGIQSAKVNEAGELIITLSNGNTINAGNVKGPSGKSGSDGENGTDGKSVVLISQELKMSYNTFQKYLNNITNISFSAGDVEKLNVGDTIILPVIITDLDNSRYHFILSVIEKINTTTLTCYGFSFIPSGENGKDGINGKDGATGPRGYSGNAYGGGGALAGTVEEFFSILAACGSEYNRNAFTGGSLTPNNWYDFTNGEFARKFTIIYDSSFNWTYWAEEMGTPQYVDIFQWINEQYDKNINHNCFISRAEVQVRPMFADDPRNVPDDNAQGFYMDVYFYCPMIKEVPPFEQNQSYVMITFLVQGNGLPEEWEKVRPIYANEMDGINSIF